nr:tryptophan--tRNA ligase [Bacteroidota bacterium]
GFASERTRYNELISNREEIDVALAQGAERARAVASEVLSRVRGKIGY